MCACIYLETVYPFSNIESCVIHIYTPTPPAKGDVRLRVIPLFVCAVHFLHREQMRLSCSKNLCERLLSNNKYCCISFEQTKRVEMKKKKTKKCDNARRLLYDDEAARRRRPQVYAQ